MSDIVCQMIASKFFLNLAFSLAPMWYDGQSISSTCKQLSLFVSIDYCHPQPLPSPIKNGETFLSAAWSLSCQTLHVKAQENAHHLLGSAIDDLYLNITDPAAPAPPAIADHEAQVVFGSPVPGLPKDRDWTRPGPIRTGKF